MRDCVLPRYVTQTSNLLPVEIHLDCGILFVATLIGSARRFDNHGHGDFLLAAEFALLPLMFYTFGTIDAGHIAFYIEACTRGRVVAVHEQCVLILDVVGGETELHCITCALVGLTGIWIVRDYASHILGDTQSVLPKVRHKAVGTPIRACHLHCHTIVGYDLIHIRIGA